MKKVLAIPAIMILIICLFNSCYSTVGKDESDSSLMTNVEWIDKESSYNRYEVKGNKVNIYCTLTFKNKSDKPAVFYLSADFADDLDLGLVTEGLLYGVNKEDGKDTLFLEAYEKKTFEYIFKGDFGGVKRKATRECPDIEIQEIKD